TSRPPRSLHDALPISPTFSARKRERSESAKGTGRGGTEAPGGGLSFPFPSFFALSLFSRFRAETSEEAASPPTRPSASGAASARSEEHTSELQSRFDL